MTAFGYAPRLNGSVFFPPVPRPRVTRVTLTQAEPPVPRVEAVVVPIPPMLSPGQRIIRVACLMFGVSERDLRTKYLRSAPLVAARTYAAVRLTQELGLSRGMVGRMLNRDHSSVINLLQRAGVAPAPVFDAERTAKVRIVRMFRDYKLDTATIARRMFRSEAEVLAILHAWRWRK